MPGLSFISMNCSFSIGDQTSLRFELRRLPWLSSSWNKTRIKWNKNYMKCRVTNRKRLKSTEETLRFSMRSLICNFEFFEIKWHNCSSWCEVQDGRSRFEYDSADDTNSSAFPSFKPNGKKHLLAISIQLVEMS